MDNGKLQARRGDRRDAILDVARDCFLAEGYGKTSMSTISSRLGGSKSTLYTYFTSKEELFDAFVRRSCDQLMTSFMEFPDDEPDLRRRMVRLANAFLEKLMSPDAIAIQRLVIGEGERFPELGQAFYAAGPMRGLGRLTEQFQALMERGELRRADPKLAAYQFKGLAIAGFYELRLWGVIGNPTKEEIRARAETTADFFLRAYAP